MKEIIIVVTTLVFMLMADLIGGCIFAAIMTYTETPWLFPLAFIAAGIIGFPVVYLVLVVPYKWLLTKLEVI